MFTRNFVDTHFPRLIAAAKKRLQNMTSIELKNIKKYPIAEILSSLEFLYGRRLSNDDRKVAVHFINLEIGIMCLKQPQLECRITGTKYIAEPFNFARTHLFLNTERVVIGSVDNPRSRFQKALIQEAKAHDLLRLYYDKTATHLEIISRSVDLLKILFMEKAMTLKEMIQLWEIA